MTLEQYFKLLETQKKTVEKLVQDQLPIKVGRIAQDHFQENFRQQGFVDGGLTPWPKTKRQLSGNRSAASQYGALLSSRNHLFKSIRYVPQQGKVTVSTNLKYAPIHNWGGEITRSVTRATRGHAWKKYYKKKDKANHEQAAKWKALALTKKEKLRIRIPQRQFLGESRELTEKINGLIEKELDKLLL